MNHAPHPESAPPDAMYDSHDAEPEEAELTFHEQADGRRVSRLPGGKVVLVNVPYMDTVSDGERWRVRLRHKDTFAIADPVERLIDNPLLTPEVADRIREEIVARPGAAGEPEATTLESEAVNEPSPAPGREAKASPIEARQAERARAGRPTPERVVRPVDRVAFFVDGANMDGACREARYFVDYGKAREFFLSAGTFYAAFYYVADFTSQDPLQQRYLDFLSHAGYIVRRKPVKLIRDSQTGERIIKGNLDTEIVLDMMNTADNYDLAFLFSGDSDFERAVELLRSRGKRVYLVTSRGSLSRELGYVADKPIFLIENFESELRRDQ